MIEIIPYQSSWPEEFRGLARVVRETLGTLALRIDHIGSTSVPGLAAKDVIDIQVMVTELAPPIEVALGRVGFRRLEHITADHVPPGWAGDADEWKKWFFKAGPEMRAANLHVRVDGRANQRYALLFRDYLRAHEPVAQAYTQVKSVLARLHPTNVNEYYDVKDPVCDIIIGGAEEWAAQVEWVPGPSDC